MAGGYIGMAKKKLTVSQKKANRRKAYTRREYYKNIDAIDYMRDFVNVEEIKIPKKITKSSLKKVQKIYREAKKIVQEEIKEVGAAFSKVTGEIIESVKSKKEIVKEIRTQEPYRQSRATPKRAPKDFNPDEDYIAEIRSLIDEISPMRETMHSNKYYEEKLLPKFNEAKNRILGSIDYARMKAGEAETAAILAANQFVQRVANLQEKYTYEIIESIDDDLIPLIESSIGEALNGV